MSELSVLIAICFLTLLVWKHLQVSRFFSRPIPAGTDPALVSILQPILSGDPTLQECLAQNLRFKSRYPVEFIWLVDGDDVVAQQVCAGLIGRYPARPIRLVSLPPPGDDQNPKLVKLIEGEHAAEGDIICVLDDDTMLPDGGLEQCLPFLDQPGVGLAFGLPYYCSFQNIWSRLIASFVNSNSLLTYIPYTVLTEPFTINGMFFAVRRSVLSAVGGFAGLETTLADDFAVAQRFRAHGYRLAQTPLRHAISTFVTGPRHYLSLIQRWFIFPRESLMRHLPARQLLLLYGMALLPAFFPLFIVIVALLWPVPLIVALAFAYYAFNFASFAHNNIAYLAHACPWRYSWLVPIVQLIFPIQLLVALLSPQRIAWRGHLMQLQRGGGFQIVRRRSG
jgi:ceramide glucosyltransferase